jgi:hypothetical protein
VLSLRHEWYRELPLPPKKNRKGRQQRPNLPRFGKCGVLRFVEKNALNKCVCCLAFSLSTQKTSFVFLQKPNLIDYIGLDPKEVPKNKKIKINININIYNYTNS